MSAFDQARFQVRLDWGVDGMRRLAPADIYVVVDVLGTLSGVFDTVYEDAGDLGGRGDLGDLAGLVGSAGALSAAGNDGAAALVAAAGLEHTPTVFFAGLRNATATARAVYSEQNRRAARTSIALIAAGHDGRFPVEDQLGAGAVADALAALGIDHSAPDVAVAGESFRSLRRAVKHLLTASGSGLALEDAGVRSSVVAAARVDDVDRAIRYVDGALVAE